MKAKVPLVVMKVITKILLTTSLFCTRQSFDTHILEVAALRRERSAILLDHFSWVYSCL